MECEAWVSVGIRKTVNALVNLKASQPTHSRVVLASVALKHEHHMDSTIHSVTLTLIICHPQSGTYMKCCVLHRSQSSCWGFGECCRCRYVWCEQVIVSLWNGKCWQKNHTYAPTRTRLFQTELVQTRASLTSVFKTLYLMNTKRRPHPLWKW